MVGVGLLLSLTGTQSSALRFGQASVLAATEGPATR
jgi:hypothetical protein